MVAAIVEAIIALISSIIEAIASLFVAGGEALGAGEALILLIVFLAELILWLVLWCVELVTALFKWRKPSKVPKPIIWRPKKLMKREKEDPKEK